MMVRVMVMRRRHAREFRGDARAVIVGRMVMRMVMRLNGHGDIVVMLVTVVGSDHWLVMVRHGQAPPCLQGLERNRL
jgi:hypothetical protein